MSKKAVSVTLDTDNVAWLEGQVTATRARGLSGVLDQLVTEARMAGRVDSRAIRSVAGTIDINPADPQLGDADRHVQALFGQSLSRPWIAREQPTKRQKRRPRG